MVDLREVIARALAEPRVPVPFARLGFGTLDPMWQEEFLKDANGIVDALTSDGFRIVDTKTVAAIAQLVEQASAYGAVPSPWEELEVVRAWLGASPAG